MVYGKGIGKTFFSGAVCLRGPALDSLLRKRNFTFTKSKMSLPFTLLPVSLCFEVLGLNIRFFIFREAMNAEEGHRKTKAKWCILFYIKRNGSKTKQTNKPCVFPFLGIKPPTLFTYSRLSWSSSFLEEALTWSWCPQSSILLQAFRLFSAFLWISPLVCSCVALVLSPSHFAFEVNSEGQWRHQ